VPGVTRGVAGRRTEHSLDERIAASKLAPSEASVAREASQSERDPMFENRSAQGLRLAFPQRRPLSARSRLRFAVSVCR
jgi:hypothetical protein